MVQTHIEALTCDIHCDGELHYHGSVFRCQAVLKTGKASPRKARKAAEKKGWVVGAGGHDFCPGCVATRELFGGVKHGE